MLFMAILKVNVDGGVGGTHVKLAISSFSAVLEKCEVFQKYAQNCNVRFVKNTFWKYSGQVTFMERRNNVNVSG